MAEAAELAQLKDIHLPQAIGWWPPAPGWYIVFALLILLSVFVVYTFYKRAVYARPKKQALALLQTYEQHYSQQKNSQLTSARISELLRRVALVYYPRAKVASLHGQQWVDFLNQTCKHIDFNSVQSLLIEAPFKMPQNSDLKPLFTKAQQWIKQRKRPCLN